MMRRRCGRPVVVVPRRRCGVGLMGTAIVATAAASAATNHGARKSQQQQQQKQQKQQQQIYYQQKQIEKLKAEQQANAQPKVIYVQAPQQAQYVPPPKQPNTIQQQPNTMDNNIYAMEGVPQAIPSAPPMEYAPPPKQIATEPLTGEQYQYVKPKEKTKIIYGEKPAKKSVKTTSVEKENDKGCAFCIIL